MTTRDTRPGSTGGADVPVPLYGGPDDDYTPEQLAAMSRQELDRLGAHYDGVEILHVDPGPEPGSPLEKRAVRQVGLVFTLAGVFAFLFVVVYVGSGWFLPDWHWEITEQGWSAFFTPLLGLFMGLALGLVGDRPGPVHQEAAPARDRGAGQARRFALRPGDVRRDAGLGLPQQRAGPPQADHPVAAASWAAASG